MSGLIADGQALTLADYESMVTDKDVSRKVLIHTIRDYMPFFDQGVILPANNGDTDKGQIITKYPEGQLRAYNEGWVAEEVLGAAARYTASMVRTRSGQMLPRKAHRRGRCHRRRAEGDRGRGR